MNKEIVLNIDGSHNGFEYVNLDLPSGTMWATCNVGANKPEDDGLLFQFGRVDGYKYGDTNNKFTIERSIRYTHITTSGKVCKYGDILDLIDDAAHVHMGGKWRMPTKDDLKELCNNTIIELTKINKVNGMLFTSKINNKQLFIPFAGYWYNGTFRAIGRKCNMWTSQLDNENNYVNHAYRLTCDYIGYGDTYLSFCTYGFSIRGVFKK